MQHLSTLPACGDGLMVVQLRDYNEASWAMAALQDGLALRLQRQGVPHAALVSPKTLNYVHVMQGSGLEAARLCVG